MREIRQRRGLTLTDVAAAAGVTKGFLSLFERGLKSVSVPTLLSLCDALAIEIAELFDFPDQEIVRGGAGGRLQMGGNDIVEYLLTPASERHVQVMRTVLDPGGGSGGAYRLKCETIFVLVIRGALELTVGGRTYLLNVGDTTTFSGHTAHAWSNPSSTESEVVWVLAPPLPDRIVGEMAPGLAGIEASKSAPT